jgi:uncharacterized OsmC-like protein
MADSSICLALQRAEQTLSQKPHAAVQRDTAAHATLRDGLAVDVRHPEGHVLTTDMPATLGGSGEHVSPGWLMRAGLAACTATVIAMHAHRLGIVLDHLEVTACSRSDARGMLGLDDAVPAGPLEVELEVEIAAAGLEDSVLRDLVAWADTHSPVGNALRRAMEIKLEVRCRPQAVH